MVQFDFRKKSNGVPVLSKNEIEIMAEMIMADYNPNLLAEPGALDVDDLIEYYANLEVDYKDLSPDQSILGMMVFYDTLVPVYNPVSDTMEDLLVEEGTIIIDNSLLEDDQMKRGRFTQGHEISHWFLHRHIYLKDQNQMTLFDVPHDPTIKCRSIDIENNTKRQLVTSNDWMEWQADYMASTLLMPRLAFTKAVNKLFREAGIKNGYYEMGTDDDYDLWAQMLPHFLSDIFNVSVTAASIRLQNFDFIRNKHMPYNVRLAT